MKTSSQHQHRPSSGMARQKPGRTRQASDKPPTGNVSQGVTTNPHDVGAGGGSTPLGQHGQDSRTWTEPQGRKTQVSGSQKKRSR